MIADGPLVSEAAHQAVRATDEALGVPLKDVLLGVVGVAGGLANSCGFACRCNAATTASLRRPTTCSGTKLSQAAKAAGAAMAAAEDVAAEAEAEAARTEDEAMAAEAEAAAAQDEAAAASSAAASSAEEGAQGVAAGRGRALFSTK